MVWRIGLVLILLLCALVLNLPIALAHKLVIDGLRKLSSVSLVGSVANELREDLVPLFCFLEDLAFNVGIVWVKIIGLDIVADSLMQSAGYALIKSKSLARGSQKYSGWGLNAWVLIGFKESRTLEKSAWGVSGSTGDPEELIKSWGWASEAGEDVYAWGNTPVGLWGFVSVPAWRTSTPLALIQEKIKEYPLSANKHKALLSHWLGKVESCAQAFELDGCIEPLSNTQTSVDSARVRVRL